ncbi:MAG: glycosyltransferase family 39 protein [Candidatus Woesearchaeota archaeon]|nr:MAG: glycosyltransferase family 39 protein [Candidatus Woesearchaeota archaeon]
MKKKNRILVFGLLAFASILRFIPLYRSRGLMNLENFISNLLAIVMGIPILILIYLIAKKASKNEKAALFSLALASVIPFYSWIISNALSSAIGIFFFFLIVYLLPRLKEKKVYLILIGLLLLYTLFNPCSWIMIPLLIIYYILIRVEHLKKDKIEDYFLYIATIGLVLLTLALSYSGSILYVFRTEFLKFLHLSYSLGAINKFNLDDLFYLIGPLPVLFGLIGAYLAMKKNDRIALLLFSAIGSSFIVTLYLGSIFAYVIFSLSMACLASFAYLFIKDRLEQSRLTKFTNSILIVIVLLILIFGINRWIL